MTTERSNAIIAVPSAVITLTDTRRGIQGVECGALGALVVKDGQPGFLACNHVVALNGRMPAGNPIGMRMANGLSRRIGALAAWDFLDDSPGAVNPTDSAVVLFDPDVMPRLDFAGLGGAREVRYRSAAPQPGGRVIKYGPNTGLTRGWIETVDHSQLMYYDFGTYYLGAQVVIRGDGGEPFSGKGDSGALVFTDGEGFPREPVAMVWGGGDGLTFASPLEVCLARLGVSLLQ